MSLASRLPLNESNAKRIFMGIQTSILGWFISNPKSFKEAFKYEPPTKLASEWLTQAKLLSAQFASNTFGSQETRGVLRHPWQGKNRSVVATFQGEGLRVAQGAPQKQAIDEGDALVVLGKHQ